MMNDFVNDDEIDLRELFKAIWLGRTIIFVSVVASIALAVVYLWSADRKFTVNYTLQTVSSDGAGAKFSSLGGLAAIAGVSIPTGGSNELNAFKSLIQSEEVAAELLKDENLIREMYAGEWNVEDSLFARPKQSMFSQLKLYLKVVLTGGKIPVYIPPNPARVSNWLKSGFTVSEDNQTGFLKLESETSSPDLVLKVILSCVVITDRIIKDRFIEGAENTIAFYQSKISSANAREHREALAQLITQEQKKLMLASSGSFYVVQPLTAPTISMAPTSPKSSLVLALSLVLGGFIGVAFVLIRGALRSADA